MGKTYVQAVDGVVNLIGGTDVGLFSERETSDVIVKELKGPVELGWIWDGVYFSQMELEQATQTVDPIIELNLKVDDLMQMILETGGAIK